MLAAAWKKDRRWPAAEVGRSVARGSSHRAAGSSRHHPLPTQNVAFADWMTPMDISRVDPTPASNHSTSPPVVRPDSSVRRTARIVGVLFLAGYLTYGVGNLIATGIVDSDDRSDSTALFVTGIALMLLNSAFVIGIGVLMFPILRAHNKAIAAGYLGTRIFEGVVLAIGVVSLIVLTSLRRHRRECRFLQRRRGRARYRKPLLLRSALPHRTRAALASCLGLHRLRMLRRGQPAGAVRRRGRRARRRHPRWIVRADVRHLADRPRVRLHRDRPLARKHLTDLSAPAAIRSVWTTRNNKPGAFGLRNAGRS